MEVVIDAKGGVLGRIASFAAKQALKGKKVIIVNAEKAIIIGKPKKILEHYLAKFRRGTPNKGPFYSRTVIGIFKRTIRGMIAWKKAHGREAFKRIKCYKSMPKEYEGKEKLSFEKKATNFITLGELSKLIRQK